MKKVLLSVALLFTSSVANAAGLYLSAGYGVGDPDMSYSTTTCASDDVNCYGDAITLLPGWPAGTPNAQGYEASAWAAGLKEEYFYNTEDTSTTSFAIGWAIPKNPFRFEAEYQKTKFKSPNYVMRINDPNGKWCESGSDVCVSTPYYDFDVNFYQPTDISVDSYMANVYFEIPGLGALDPYIGYGIGMSKVDFTFYDAAGQSITGGSDGNVSSHQFIAGLEYRLTDTPFIIGAEYRQFKVDFDERDDKVPYELEHNYFMLKLKYDFVSDVF